MNDAAPTDPLPIQIEPTSRLLTAAEFQKLADVPPEVEWFANISNHHTGRAYENAVKDFMRFAGIRRPEEFRIVTRAHLIAWRDELRRRGLGGATIRHRLASLASLFEYLCEKNAVTHNPVKGVERPKTESGAGKTPAIGDHQARKLLDAPQADNVLIGDLSIYTSYCRAAGFLISPVLTSQRAASDFLKDILVSTNSEAVWSQGQLKIVPYGDQDLSGNGAGGGSGSPWPIIVGLVVFLLVVGGAVGVTIRRRRVI